MLEILLTKEVFKASLTNSDLTICPLLDSSNNNVLFSQHNATPVTDRARK